jgi:hypothetical protein
MNVQPITFKEGWSPSHLTPRTPEIISFRDLSSGEDGFHPAWCRRQKGKIGGFFAGIRAWIFNEQAKGLTPEPFCPPAKDK